MRRVFLFVALLTFLALPALAQVELSFGGGYLFPSGDTAESTEGGHVIGGNAGYFLTERLCVGAEFYYHKLGLTDFQKQDLEELEMEVEKSLIDFTATVKYLLTTGSTSLYVKGIAGSYEYKEKIFEEDYDRLAAEKYRGIGAGLGIQFQSEGFFGGFIEGVYNHVFLPDDLGLDYDLELDYDPELYDNLGLNYVSVRAGIILKGY